MPKIRNDLLINFFSKNATRMRANFELCYTSNKQILIITSNYTFISAKERVICAPSSCNMW